MVLLTLRSSQGLTLGVKTDQGVADTGLDPARLFAQGVAFGRRDEVYLCPGDVYTVEIDKLGCLQNRLVS